MSNGAWIGIGTLVYMVIFSVYTIWLYERAYFKGFNDSTDVFMKGHEIGVAHAVSAPKEGGE